MNGCEEGFGAISGSNGRNLGREQRVLFNWVYQNAGMGSKQLPKSLLAHGEEWSCTAGNLEIKTRTGMILQYP